jgi:pimeloyl-ACP methyl ester carboxylesterase
MTTQPVMIQSGRVTTEGDDLYYEVRGQGQPLLMIAPGGGDGWQYSSVAEILADEYKVICYDRRANGPLRCAVSYTAVPHKAEGVNR